MEGSDAIALRKQLTEDLIVLQQSTPEQPYSIVHRLKLAKYYKDLGYPDLAVGDAYKALLLVDEVIQEGEYHEEAREAAEADFLSEQMANLAVETSVKDAFSGATELEIWIQSDLSRTAYDILIGCLLDCGCFRSAFDYVTRARKAFENETIFMERGETLSKKLRSQSIIKGEDFDESDVDEYPDKGTVRRENYPWNEFEPDRFSDECLQSLNEEMEGIAPKLEVKIAELPLLNLGPAEQNPDVQFVKQLGVFAKEDIPPGEEILKEKSLLTAVSRLHDTYCNACSAVLPDSRDAASSHEANSIVSCEECNEVFFCGLDCHDLAQDSYHPSLCGVTVDLGKVPAREAADSLYTLLLVRALALAETQDLHPLELKELRYIWGDYHGLQLDEVWRVDREGRLVDSFGSVPQSLPFSFASNVLTPLHILEKMDVNIFTQSHRYDTWVFNILYAKFRGTASAQQGPDGRPEIGAVHPMWCLANHSCDPNVAWEWQGSMRFWTRDKLVDWNGRDSSRKPGIRQGEEVFGHYCDIRLPVKERREWAVGALGGDCMCPRCIWEEAEERRRHRDAVTR